MFFRVEYNYFLFRMFMSEVYLHMHLYHNCLSLTSSCRISNGIGYDYLVVCRYPDAGITYILNILPLILQLRS